MGRRIGRLRWCIVFGKTVEGSIAFFLSVLGVSWIMWTFGIVDDFNVRSSHFFLLSLPSPTARGRTEKTDLFFFCSLSAIVIFFSFHVQFKPYAITVGLSTLLEAFSAQNDNLILPMFGWAVGTLLGV